MYTQRLTSVVPFPRGLIWIWRREKWFRSRSNDTSFQVQIIFAPPRFSADYIRKLTRQWRLFYRARPDGSYLTPAQTWSTPRTASLLLLIEISGLLWGSFTASFTLGRAANLNGVGHAVRTGKRNDAVNQRGEYLRRWDKRRGWAATQYWYLYRWPWLRKKISVIHTWDKWMQRTLNGIQKYFCADTWSFSRVDSTPPTKRPPRNFSWKLAREMDFGFRVVYENQ